MNSASQLAFGLTEQGLVPDIVIRRGIRFMLKQRLQEIRAHDVQAMALLQNDFVQAMQHAAVALVPEKANEQHYEVPAEFYTHVLGPHLKYSCAYWPDGTATLAEAETHALQAYCDRAELADGQSILELGCGWGSLTLYMAGKFPNSTIRAVSNSHSQREYIEARARGHGLDNIQITTCDMNEFSAQAGQYDRVISVEMFEHMRNWAELYRGIAGWLKPGGRFFKHIFVHRTVPYAFEDNGPSDWMSRHFFTGGMMPSDDLPAFFQNDLHLLSRWRWDGRHYEKTSNTWLENMDRQRDTLIPLFKATYGEAAASMWWVRWRLFFMACAELFGYHNGQEWFVSHYLFEKPAR